MFGKDALELGIISENYRTGILRLLNSLTVKNTDVQTFYTDAVPVYNGAGSPDGKSFYLADWRSSLLYVIDKDSVSDNLVNVTSVTTHDYPMVVLVSQDSKYVYVFTIGTNYLQINSNTYVYSRNLSTGAFNLLQTINGTAIWDALISPDGKNIYVMNFGFGFLNCYTRDVTAGTISNAVQVTLDHSSGWRMAISPDGKFLYVCYHQYAYITVFSRNTTNGALINTGKILISSGTLTTADVIVSPDGNHLYVLMLEDGSIQTYAIDKVTGGLTSMGSTSSGNGSWRNSNPAISYYNGTKLAITPDGSNLYNTYRYWYYQMISGGALTLFSGTGITEFFRNINNGSLTLIDYIETPGKQPTVDASAFIDIFINPAMDRATITVSEDVTSTPANPKGLQISQYNIT